MDTFFTKNSLIDRIYTEFGGLKGDKHSGIIPTAQTAAFIIGGGDISIHVKLEGLRRSRVTKWHKFNCSVAARRSQSSRRCACVKCGRQRRGPQCSMLALVESYSQGGALRPLRAS